MSYFVAIETRQSEEALLKNDHAHTSDRPTFQKGSTARKSDRFRRGPASDSLLKQAITDKKGTILIVDISGYSQFVQQADNTAGASVIASLLGSIIRNNTVDFHISEIEGDAILFYKYGAALPVTAVLLQFEQSI